MTNIFFIKTAIYTKKMIKFAKGILIIQKNVHV